MTGCDPQELRSDIGSVPMLSDENVFKVGVFGANNRHGTWYVDDERATTGSWEEILSLATLADEAGMDGWVPVGRWRSHGGRTDFNGFGLDSTTSSAALAAVTERIQVFTTVHVPYAHPIKVAKEGATIDQISAGRFALNVVAAGKSSEMAMFGVDGPAPAERYDYADEWMRFVESLWATQEPFDFEGEYIRSPGAYNGTPPVQAPRPTVMSAAISGEGRAFAARHADINFIVVADLDDLAATACHVEETKAMARDFGRDIKVMLCVGIVCDSTERAARSRFERYVTDQIDREAVRNFLGAQVATTTQGWAFDSAEVRAAIGTYSTPLVGAPDQIVDGLVRLSEAGLDGAALNWVDYVEGIEQYRAELRPLLIEAGLRTR